MATTVIKDVYFYYTCIKTPKNNFNHKDSTEKNLPLTAKEYKTDFCLTAADYKALKKEFGTVKGVKNARKMPAEEFVEKFKVNPPSDPAYLNGDDEYTIISVTAFAAYPDGEPAPQPQVLGTNGRDPAVRKDRDGNEVGEHIEIGNGSEGCIQLKVRPWTVFGGGISLDLKMVQIRHLVPYEDEVGFDFDEEEEYDPEDVFDKDEDDKPSKPQAPSGDPDWDI